MLDSPSRVDTPSNYRVHSERTPWIFPYLEECERKSEHQLTPKRGLGAQHVLDERKELFSERRVDLVPDVLQNLR